ncbi:MAG: PKD domain-containing protein [Zoogloeaceae bacterium]|nr:PKD domain-containing protein [Zoogloeaceae bacterium]
MGIGNFGKGAQGKGSRQGVNSARHQVTLSAMAAVLLATFGSQALAADPARTPQRTLRAFPDVSLEHAAQGEGAIQALGSRLSAVAQWYGKSAAELSRELRQDQRARIDRKGRLFYVDENPEIEDGTTAGGSATVSAEALVPVDQTFFLHSRPGAKRVIYLDFRGAVISGTAWNASYGLSTINAQPFDVDGVTGLSTAELERIQYIWQRVSEDYAPFDVDVTTEEPSADALTRSTSSDDTFGTRVIVTRDWTAATGSSCGCGGFAYVGIFDDVGTYYKPAWVFFDSLGGGNEKYVAEAISHEAGHNLGLSHDGYNNGTTNVGYYTGHGSGETGWAPIMGVGYYQNLVQWSKGEYAYATQTQDDFQVIQTTGAPLRADDHGDTLSNATPLTTSTADGVMSLDGSGVIGTRTDVDAFSFDAGAGPLTLTVTPAARGPNLDVSAKLYNATGGLVASANPTDALAATITATLAEAGTYYVLVDGIGKGTVSTGYSDYGSLGAYTLSGSAIESGAGQAPIAAAAGSPTSGTVGLIVQFSSAGSSDPDGGSLTYDWDFGDGSAHASTPNPAHGYNSAGNFTAILRVTDPSGRSATAQVPVTVTAPVVTAHVANIGMSLVAKSRSYQAKAIVTVVDVNGVAVSGAAVTGQWSGLVAGNASGTTSSTGQATFLSSSTSKRGTYTFTVTGISKSGYSYDSAANTETSDSISR